MKRAARAAVLLLAAVGPVAGAGLHRSRASAADPHPIEKVIGLLKSLIQQVTQEGQEEELTYAKFDSWCKNSIKTLDKSVVEDKSAIDSLQSKVDAKTQENATLSEQIDSLAEEILKYTTSGEAADKARSDAAALYTQADADLGTTIQAFTDAIAALKDAKTSTSALVQAKVQALAQLPASALGVLSTRQIAQLSDAVRRSTEAQAPGAPAPAVPDFIAKGDYDAHVKKYSFKSDNIVELLKELKASFEDQRLEATKAETNAVNAYNLAKNALSNALEAAKAAKAEKETARGNAQTELATAQASLTDEQADLVADTTKFDDTKRDCDVKKSEWEERSGIRAKELKALEVGIEILSKVSGVRTAAPTNPILPPAPADAPPATGAALLLQTDDPRVRAVNLLRKEASRLHSASFQKFAEEVAAKVGGPFDDVNGMIQKMIFRLMAEQKDEDDHKNWCDLEIQKTNSSKAEKEDKLAELETKIAQAKGSVEELTQQIQTASDMVAQITTFIQEATEVRTVGKKENALAVADAKKAQAAIAQAIGVIEQFYRDSGAIPEASFVQASGTGSGGAPVQLSDKPETWAASYTGVADPTKQPEGIVSVLKEISSDFSQMEADTLAQEETDQKNYEEEMKSSEIEKARRAKESEMKSQEKTRLVQKTAELEKTKKHVQQAHAAVEQYLKDLEPACMDGDSTYEDRKGARTAEIESLKEAQVILESAFDAAAAPAAAPAGLFLSRVHRVRL